MTRLLAPDPIALLRVLLVACVVAVPRAHGSSCSADCVRRMAECRAQRCVGLAAKPCRDRCRAVTGCRAGGARIRTLATVVSECWVAGGIWTARQRLELKRGDCPATTVTALDSGSVPDPADSLCEGYGRSRDGSTAVGVGAFQRLGVSPDGRTVLFELNTHVTNPAIHGPPFTAAEGIYALGPDGIVRRLGAASRERAYRAFQSPIGPYVATFLFFSFSPNGRLVAFSDRGPGDDGSDAAQVVVMTLPSGKRTQVTHFVAAHQGNATGQDAYGVFLDDETLGVFGYGEAGAGFFTVRPDGSGLEPIDVPSFGGGGTISTTFGVAGPVGTTIGAAFPGKVATEPIPGDAVEILLYGGPSRLLQLTSFGRSDTTAGPSLNTGDRVFFLASADPFGANPQKTCQLFSVDRFGTRLRQVTKVLPAAHSSFGCAGGASSPRECRVALTQPVEYDARARSLVFDATCDPYGLHPVGGQVFAVRRDGAGFRQLTNYRGMQGTAAAGTLSVELPGPIETSGLKN
jgi:hypothetical protein